MADETDIHQGRNGPVATPTPGVFILIAARLAVVSFFMGLVVFFQFRYGRLNQAYLPLIPVAFAYLFSIAYAVFSRFATNLFRFAYFQLVTDALLVTGIIHFTGGAESPFPFLYILVIIGSAISLSKSATYVIATEASVFFAVMLGLEFQGIIHPFYVFPPSYKNPEAAFVLITAIMNITSFYLVAFLSGYLTGLLRKTDQRLIEKNQDFTLLKAFHENVLSNMGSGFMAMDMDGTILSHNPAAEKMLGLRAEEIGRQKIWNIFNRGALGRFFENPPPLDNQPGQAELSHMKGDGTRVDINMTISKLSVDGAIQGVIAVFQDVTGIKNMERQVAHAERLAAIGRMAAGIAHEIRNPLASLSGSIQILSADLDPLLDQSGKRLINIITRETDRLNRIITQFLLYTSPPRLRPFTLDAGNIIRETVTLLQSDPRVKDKMTIRMAVQPEVFVEADDGQFRQAIWNLCVNAIDAMGDSGTLIISVGKDGPLKDSRPMAWIIIEDTGGGIPPENLDRIFEPFFTTKSGGTGLGLPLAHKIIESHGGKIEAWSVLGRGTRFIVSLPLALKQAAAPVA
ncbi:MAG: PAS domain S-box protein [Nitrospinae bacterium]|nr:PAS domain S-box protein [Nitrospinota bacterium]MBF0633040.1 PAS domain S-box protein [Nitrospinota bacterium]